MSLFRWLKNLIAGDSDRLERRFRGEGICPYCGQPLRTNLAQQCFACGVDWHDPANPVQLGTPREKDEFAEQFRRSIGASSPGHAKPPIVRPPESIGQRPSDVTLQGFELEKFAPLSADDAASMAHALGRPTWTNPWFGRRDLIPPVDDPRTILIDRQMINEGLISAEELNEIHKIGAEMDRIRPDIAHAKLKAEQVVSKSREEHAKLVAKKKAEAAHRRQKRAAEIAHRKKNDIVFLGRGVSRGLADRKSNIEKLKSADLPVLSTPAELAEAIGISVPQLRWLAFHAEAAERSHYVLFSVAKKNGGIRQLAAPHQNLRHAQAWILEHVVKKIAIHGSAHGFVAGRSSLTGAQQHVNANILVNVDLKEYFPGINVFRVIGLMQNLGYSPAVSTILALLVTECPRQKVRFDGQTFFVANGQRALPQGACTSPGISNLIARNLDRRLNAIAGKIGWTYTRYADDISFSTKEGGDNMIGYVLARIRHICQDEGFEVNESKTRILRKSNRQTVTGIVVNEKPNIDRKTIRRIRAILHNAESTGLEAQNRQNHPDFRRWLQGMIAYIAMVNPGKGKDFREAFERL